MPRPRVARMESHTLEIAASLKRERPDLDPTDYLFLLYLQRMGRILDTIDERECRARFGISAADMRVLYALRRAGPPYALRPTELFRALLVSSGAITKQVDRLIAAGFVDRLPGPQRSGGFLIHLTEKGMRAANDGLEALTNSSMISVDILSREERETMCEQFERLLMDFESRLEDGTPDEPTAAPAKAAGRRASTAKTPASKPLKRPGQHASALSGTG